MWTLALTIGITLEMGIIELSPLYYRLIANTKYRWHGKVTKVLVRADESIKLLFSFNQDMKTDEALMQTLACQLSLVNSRFSTLVFNFHATLVLVWPGHESWPSSVVRPSFWIKFHDVHHHSVPCWFSNNCFIHWDVLWSYTIVHLHCYATTYCTKATFDTTSCS